MRGEDEESKPEIEIFLGNPEYINSICRHRACDILKKEKKLTANG